VSTYRVTIDVSRVHDTQHSGDDWDRWCNEVTPEGLPIANDAVTGRGANNNIDVWDVSARRPAEARRIVAQYAKRCACDVDVLTIERRAS